MIVAYFTVNSRQATVRFDGKKMVGAAAPTPLQKEMIMKAKERYAKHAFCVLASISLSEEIVNDYITEMQRELDETPADVPYFQELTNKIAAMQSVLKHLQSANSLVQ